VEHILDASGVRGGLVVCVGCDDPKSLVALRRDNAYLVQGLDKDPAAVANARQWVHAKKLYGPVSVDSFNGKDLPYVANVVNLVVVSGAFDVENDEILRVLVPGGKAYVRDGDKWRKIVKPWPADIDEWTHYLYDASNNAVSRDRLVGPPGGLQWVAAPRFSRSHEQLASISAAVVAGGRIFSMEDRGPIESVAFPPKWVLVARDAFNGITLWQREMGTWEWHLHLFRAGPAHLPRRLVAMDDRVYVTLSLGGPVQMLDAATGKTLKKLDGTEGADEIVHTGKLLLVNVGHTGRDVGSSGRRGKDKGNNVSRKLMALHPVSGQTVWEKEVQALCHTTLGALGQRVFYQEGNCVVAVAVKDGKELWRSEPLSRFRAQPPTLVGYENTILWADGVDPRKKTKNNPGMLAGLDAATGRTLWQGNSENNCAISPDVLVADGLVWTGKLLLWNQPGITEGLDPKTGKVARTRQPDLETFNVGMPHHRCYRNKGASKWLILGRAGVEFLDVKTGEIYPNHWVRGTCQYGILPANGLLYVPPHACACYLTAKINGFNALRPRRHGDAVQQETGELLQRGPAYGEIGDDRAANGNSDWPTYRHDASRSGRTSANVPVSLQQLWKADIGGKLTALTIAADTCFVADTDAHTIYALDATTGNPAWTFTAGGRVDSPPTIAEGAAVFGCRDGYVYCLRAADGELVWRFRAAPQDRRTVDCGRLESLWPVNGSALVQNGTVVFAAGRSSFLDGGIRICRVDLKSGKLLAESTIYTPDPETHRAKREIVSGFDMSGVQADVLSSDGGNLFMRQLCLDRDLKPAPAKPHLFSPTGLLDDTWWHRTYWLYGKEFTSGWSTWFQAGNCVPSGRILAFADELVYGFGRQQYRNCDRGGGQNWARQEQYVMFSTQKTAQKPLTKWRTAGRIKPVPRVFLWMQESPVRARAMVLTPDTVFFAGPPNLGNSSDDAFASYRGKNGARIVAVAVENGAIKGELDLPAVPVLDGMASARGRLYLSLKGRPKRDRPTRLHGGFGAINNVRVHIVRPHETVVTNATGACGQKTEPNSK
jgi:outer membrane protein assembly factor BamB